MGFEIFVTEEELRSREVKDKRFPTLKSLLTNLLKEKFFAHSWSWADELLNYQKISTEDAYDKSCCLWLVPNYTSTLFRGFHEKCTWKHLQIQSSPYTHKLIITYDSANIPVIFSGTLLILASNIHSYNTRFVINLNFHRPTKSSSNDIEFPFVIFWI